MPGTHISQTVSFTHTHTHTHTRAPYLGVVKTLALDHREKHENKRREDGRLRDGGREYTK